MANPKSLYDSFNTRYQLIKSNPGDKMHNWLFIPGGPGADSSYFLSLIKLLDLPGNYWLIDFPNNGSNNIDEDTSQYDFDAWFDCFMTMVKQFDNPIVVGHSFGGMLPLLFPELENLLSGFVILNSAPSLWRETAVKCAEQHNLPSLTNDMDAFTSNPNEDTFKQALLACTPYYFPEATLELGKQLLAQLPFNYHAACWWQIKVQEINYNAKWIPQDVPTLIVGASHDFITPLSIFKKDVRFSRDNIEIVSIEDAGHMPWVEQPKDVLHAVRKFANNI